MNILLRAKPSDITTARSLLVHVAGVGAAQQELERGGPQQRPGRTQEEGDLGQQGGQGDLMYLLLVTRCPYYL